MVDVVRAVPTAASVEAPAIVDLADPQHSAVRSAPRFGVGDLLTGVFSDLVSFLEGDCGEAASTVYQ